MSLQLKASQKVEAPILSGPKSFLKWAGGKGKLISDIRNKLPSSFETNEQFKGTFYEPFMGSAAVFFNLSSQLVPHKVHLSDMNQELIYAFIAVQQYTTELIHKLSEYQTIHNETHGQDQEKRKEFYYSIRELDRQEGWFDNTPNGDAAPETIVSHAARFIYLNKTCFNGLWRVNSKGFYNVPIGSYKNPAICNEPVLLAASSALQNISIKLESYISAVKNAKEGDLIYFDPPYMPLSTTSSFNAYAKDAFLEKQHQELAVVYLYLAAKGVNVVLSNSDTEFTNLPLGLKNDRESFFENTEVVLEGLKDYQDISIKQLYDSYQKHWNVEKVYAARAINSKASSRGAISEILVATHK